MSNRVILKGDDFEEFKAFVQQAFSGEYGNVSEMRIAVNGGQICVGANGFVSEWLGDGESHSEPKQFDLINRAIALLYAAIDEGNLP